MLKRHDAALDRALDRLYLEGSVAISWDDLYLWFNADRLGKNAYREILRRWEELCTITYAHADAPKLYILRTTNNFPYLLRISRDAFNEKELLVEFASET